METGLTIDLFVQDEYIPHVSSDIAPSSLIACAQSGQRFLLNQWFLAPFFSPMNDQHSSSSPGLKLAELVVSAERHRFMREIIDYLKGIHYFIDPDMYNIDAKRLEHFAWCFEEDADDPSGFTMTVTSTDMFDLEIIVDAAYTYSNRKTSGSRAESLTNVGFEAILTWLYQTRRALFFSDPKH